MSVSWPRATWLYLLILSHGLRSRIMGDTWPRHGEWEPNKWMLKLLWFQLLMLDVEISGSEYCLGETFFAECSQNEVIVVDEAKFGRMSLGRCVSHDFGYLGCVANVRDRVDARCSGRHSCRFPVANQDVGILNTSPCPKDVSSYLDAEYSCHRVATCKTAQCKRGQPLRLTNPVGVLASVTTDQHSCGSLDCPWVIEAQPGQRINLTLLDFKHVSRNKTSIRGYYCHEYAVVSETDPPRTANICGGHHREKEVYMSNSHQVTVRMRGSLQRRHLNYFLLKYEAVGCPVMAAPPETWVERGDAKMTVRCNHTRESWTLVCSGTNWIGDIGNCSSKSGSKEALPRIGLPSLGISVLIIVGVALVVVIYISVSIVCVLYFRRHRRRANGEAGTSDMLMPLGLENGVRPNTDAYEENTPMLLKAGKLGRRPDGDYTDICELQLLHAHDKEVPVILKCHASPRAAPAGLGGLGGGGGGAVMEGMTAVHEDTCPVTAATSSPSFRTFKPGCRNHLYESPPHLHHATLKQCRRVVGLPRDVDCPPDYSEDPTALQDPNLGGHQPTCPNRPAMRIASYPACLASESMPNQKETS